MSSPRYADVMVHRLLAASLRLVELPESSKDRDSVRSLADNLNVRHRNAQMAGRASVELHTLIYFKNRTVLADARITKVTLTPLPPRHPVSWRTCFGRHRESSGRHSSVEHPGIMNLLAVVGDHLCLYSYSVMWRIGSDWDAAQCSVQVCVVLACVALETNGTHKS